MSLSPEKASELQSRPKDDKWRLLRAKVILHICRPFSVFLVGGRVFCHLVGNLSALVAFTGFFALVYIVEHLEHFY